VRKWLTSKKILVQKEENIKPLTNPEAAVSTRDAFVKHIYQRIFTRRATLNPQQGLAS